MAVILETSLGEITVDLYTDERPKCCINFLKLCKAKYYNFCLFHSVQRNLVAQTGDPTGTGKGGASIYEKLYGEQARYFEAEMKPRIKHKKKGALSMVNNGHNMHGSQFFVTLEENIDYLDGKHTVFGEVAEGWDVLDKMNEAFVDREGRPYQDIRIYHTVVLDDPYDDPAGLGEHIPDRSPEPTREQLDSGRIGVDEEIDDTKGKTGKEVEEMIEEKEAKANAQILEMVGDLPSTDVKPPDTVLFVCKLNPVTTEEDLEIIFSRFGPIIKSEVIKDHKTNESLQYAFIEFEKPEDCESAYFKMDNVLIDDRRIHVDFSQSVSKIQWKAKGKDSKNDDPVEKPQFVIKDRSRKDKYDLVFEEAETAKSGSSSKKNKKKKKKKHRHHSTDSDDSDHDKPKKKQNRDRSRSLSPVHHKERKLDRKEQYDSRKSSKDHHSSRDSKSDKHSDRHHRDRRDRK